MHRVLIATATAIALALMSSGCASVLRLELPDELKHKKLKEDPPISRLRDGTQRGTEA